MALTHIFDQTDYDARRANAQALRAQVVASQAQLDVIIADPSAPTAAKAVANQKQIAAIISLLLAARG